LKQTELVVVIHKNYVILLPALENHVFSPFGCYYALIRTGSGQSGLKVWLLVKHSN